MLQQHKLRVCIDARLVEGTHGGVQQTIMGLANGLSELDGDEEYLFLVETASTSWLLPHIHGSCRLLPVAGAPPTRRLVRRAVKFSGLTALADAITRALARPSAPESDGTIERAGVDVMHFALQRGFRTSVPSLYVPHDLQHLHLPDLFTRAEHRWRRAYYQPLCEQARMVVALSHWGKEDLIRSFGLAPDRVSVVGWAPILATYPEPSSRDLDDARTRFSLPEAFAFFPAQTYKHKNHIGLIEALAFLRHRFGLRIPLVLSGHRSEFHRVIEARIRHLGLQDQVHALGFVSPLDLQCLYRLSRLVVYPSRFEGFGMPVLEAFHAGVPVASSSTTSLSEIAGDAALLFDPDDTVGMAHAIQRLWSDAALRGSLITRGRGRAAQYSWQRVARSYRAIYRHVGGRPLTEEDHLLLRAAG